MTALEHIEKLNNEYLYEYIEINENNIMDLDYSVKLDALEHKMDALKELKRRLEHEQI